MKKIRTYLLLLFTSASFISHAQKVAKIDLTLWKLTIPAGTVTTFKGQKLFDYSENLDIQKFMFNDLNDKSLVFFVNPSTKAKKTELKEQNSFGGDAGWTFKQGASLKTVLKMGEVSKKDADYARVIFVQIGGRLKEEQVSLIGAKDKKAPSILKVYWDNGYVKLRSKRIANPSISGNDLLKEESWIDDDGFTFKKQVGFDKFTLQIVIKEGKMEVSVDGEKKVYSGDNYEKWGLFDNYFTVGCNPQSDTTSDDAGASAKVKYYSLEVAH
ncbi:polysaccharide lyase family 7 protein [Flavobacterium sp. WC2509]|uniref:polysaccharide lyase family 7 protein n=1 Tax=Flavobacterium sp. WC2509 TaxID=3461406 RepID=UPI0040444E67